MGEWVIRKVLSETPGEVGVWLLLECGHRTLAEIGGPPPTGWTQAGCWVCSGKPEPHFTLRRKVRHED